MMAGPLLLRRWLDGLAPATPPEPVHVQRYGRFCDAAMDLHAQLRGIAADGHADPADLALLAAFDRWAAGDLT